MNVFRMMPSLALLLAAGLFTGCDGGGDDKDTGGADGATDGTTDGTDGTTDGTDGTTDGTDGTDGADGGATDEDGDGFAVDVDCDDTNDAINPDADEVCDGVDNDCDALVDAEDDSITGLSTVYVDGDGDSFGDEGVSSEACEAGAGFALVGGDCDDANSAINPDADEVCDGVDNDCSGDADGSDAIDGDLYFTDLDTDGYGTGEGFLSCELPSDAAPVDGDCDDTNNAVNPGAEELWYDGIDADCDGMSDYDVDMDGFDSNGYGGDDCDDTNAGVSPAATEVWYDGVDANCDGMSDYDADMDGYVSAEYEGSDCDDSDAATSPGAAEVWYDGIDGDCNGRSDYDADRDGFDSDAYSGSDCDDAVAAVYPYALELSTDTDGIDNDCDGTTDAADTDARVLVYTDYDDGVSSVTFGGGFTFPFCGSARTTVKVDSNGRLHFGAGGSDFSPSGSDMTSNPTGTSSLDKAPMIAAHWDDMTADTNGDMYVVEYGDAVGVYWVGLDYYFFAGNVGPVSASALMFDDGSFWLSQDDIYNNAGVYPTDAIVGFTCGTTGTTVRETDLSAARPNPGALGLGNGTQRILWERFLYEYTGAFSDTLTSTNVFDLDGQVLRFCPTLGVDGDGDGFTADCGDANDSDVTIRP